jgi:hypothetical protein
MGIPRSVAHHFDGWDYLEEKWYPAVAYILSPRRLSQGQPSVAWSEMSFLKVAMTRSREGWIWGIEVV